jgi:hypothetical protein
MSITVSDTETGTEINLGESDTEPGKIRVTIFARNYFEVQSVIEDLLVKYECVEFTIPTLCADGKYAAIGKVWSN